MEKIQIGRKRGRTSESSRLKLSPKKRKSESVKSKIVKIKSLNGSSLATLSANELIWKEVPPPQWLDDAEGFFGLEEIDDIEVVRDASLTQPVFRSHVQSKSPRQHGRSSRERSLKESAYQAPDDGEWEGFVDGAILNLSSHKDIGHDKGPGTIRRHKAEKKERKIVELERNVPYSILENRQESNGVDISEWSSIRLSENTISAIAGLGFCRPSPIQSAVIPQILDGHDVIGKAVTGSGKTLAFAIPIYEAWLASKLPIRAGDTRLKASPFSLILTPTRELAHQLSKHFEGLVENAARQPRIVTVTGGLSIHKQLRQLNDADIIIGTPGRLWEVISDSPDLMTGLKHVKFLVIDEADRLLSEGHFKEVKEILDMLDRQVVSDDELSASNSPRRQQSTWQTLIFSATFHKGLQNKLASKSSFKAGGLLTKEQSMEYLLQKISFRETRPKFIDVNPVSQMAQLLKEGLVECSAMEKDLYLYSILIQRPREKTLVFTNSISSVRRLTPLLQNLNLSATALHSSMAQKARLRSVERFSAATTSGSILIATDVAARGLDIQNIDLILHYHVPRTADAYIHRSGRTARAANTGESILLCSPGEVAGVTKLVTQIHSEADGHQLEPLQIDRQLVARLKPRLTLSQKISTTTLAKEKVGSQDEWLRTAAAELGVDYDSDEFAAEGVKHSRGRGSTRREKQKVESSVSKSEISSWRCQLKVLLSKQINLGVSERYLAGGGVDVDSMLDSKEKNQFLNSRVSGV